MANSGENNDDFYAVLGLNKECTPTELKNAYKKLAMRWHPDRCSASGNSKFVEESKKKFQTIQRAYSVLSDENKRFLYDVGVYESDDDENGMGDFLSEMAVMMSQTKPNETSREESFEDLQQLFDEMFQVNTEPFGCNSQGSSASCSSSSSSNNKRSSSEMNNTGRTTTLKETSSFQSHFQSFCVGVDQQQQNMREGIRVVKGIRGKASGGSGGSSSSNRRRYGRKQKVSSGHDVSSNDYSGLSAC